MIYSFDPIIDADAHTLILGSMPGAASLRAGQYYAHPQNAFWKLMGELFQAGSELEYGARLQRLQSQGIAIWDVLRCCLRDGSLDSDIVESSIQANDFARLFAQYPAIRRVFFNGAKAQQCYRRHVAPNLAPGVVFQRLPSTSPAHAALDFAAKRRAWAIVAQQPGSQALNLDA